MCAYRSKPPPSGTSQGDAAQSLVAAIRSLNTEIPVEVGGTAAFLIDYKSSVADRLQLLAGDATAVPAVLSVLGQLPPRPPVRLRGLVREPDREPGVPELLEQVGAGLPGSPQHVVRQVGERRSLPHRPQNARDPAR